MYLETMERLFGGTDKIILDSGAAVGGVVPYLPLDELTRPAQPRSRSSREAADESSVLPAACCSSSLSSRR